MSEKHTPNTAKQFMAEIKAMASPGEAKKFLRYFKTGKGEYGEGDIFIGVRMGQVFLLAKKYIEMPPSEIEKLLESPIHENRAGACSIMGQQASKKKTSEERRKELYDLYLRRHDRINNWDLVDLASYKVVGSYLYDFKKSRTILYKLVRSKNMWERRTAIVSTLYFIKKGDLEDTFLLAEKLLSDKHDLIHKGMGWALRFAGQKNISKLLEFLDKHAAFMPRTALRYAIEKLDAKKRKHYMALKGSA